MDTTKRTKRQPGPPWLMLFLVLVLGLTMFSNLTSSREVPGMTLDLGPAEVAAGAPAPTGTSQTTSPSVQRPTAQQPGAGAASTATALQGRGGVVVPKTSSTLKVPTDATRSPLKRLP